MKTQLRALITDLIEGGLSALRAAGTVPADLVSPDFVIERPKERAHGDFSTNAAMLLARELGKRGAKTNPRALAQQLVLCAIGRATRRRFLCYSAPERLLLQPGLADAAVLPGPNQPRTGAA